MSKPIIIIDDKELEKLQTFKSSCPIPDNDDCSTEFPLEWKYNQTFQFSNQEVQELYVKDGLTLMITARSIDFFSQGRKPSELKSMNMEIWRGNRGQGFIYNGRLAKNEENKLVIVYNFAPAANKGDGNPRTNFKDEPFSYQGKPFDMLIGSPLRGTTGPLHTKAEYSFLDAAETEAEKEFYSIGKLNVSGGIWVGETKHIGVLYNKSVSQNFPTFRYNPLLLLQYCDFSDDSLSENSIGWFKRRFPSEIFKQTESFFIDVLPVKPGQEKGIMDTNQEDSFHLILNWKHLTPAMKKKFLSLRLIHFAKNNPYPQYEIIQIKEEKSLEKIKFDQGKLYILMKETALEYGILFNSGQEIRGKINFSELNHTILGPFSKKKFSAFLPNIFKIIYKKNPETSSRKYYDVETLLFHCQAQNIDLNLNQTDDNHITAFAYCIINKKFESALKLLEAGADSFITDIRGYSALDFAEPEVKPFLCEKLTSILEKQYSLDMKTSHSNTLLHDILLKEPLNYEHALFVLRSNPNIFIRNRKGLTLLDCFTQKINLNEGDSIIARMLLERGAEFSADIKPVPNFKDFVMMQAAKGDFSFLPVLSIDDLGFISQTHDTFLHFTVSFRNIEMTKLLLSKKIELLTIPNALYSIPLDLAKTDDRQMIELLEKAQNNLSRSLNKSPAESIISLGIYSSPAPPLSEEGIVSNVGLGV